MGFRKFSKNYEGTLSPCREAKNLLADTLKEIEEKMSSKPDNVLKFWEEIIGQKIASFAKAISLEQGILTVEVNSSTLLSLLRQQEKKRLLEALQGRFSKKVVREIIFRMG